MGRLYSKPPLLGGLRKYLLLSVDVKDQLARCSCGRLRPEFEFLVAESPDRPKCYSVHHVEVLAFR